VSKLVTSEGEILVPGIKELVAPLTDEERKRYDLINFTVKVGAKPLYSSNGAHR
jgi:Cys-Gly metallodipeptidase DUG1